MNAPERRLAVVIPALNEVAAIGAVVRGAVTVAAHVYVIDDGSTDGTAAAARGAGASIVRNAQPAGYDAAIASGINRAFAEGANAVVTCDADGQHRIDDVIRVAALILDGDNDFAAGLRDRYNRRIEGAIGVASRLLYRTPDPFCGLKGYHRRLYERIGPFPASMNVGTLPLAWVRRYELRAGFTPVAAGRRADVSRFARPWIAEWRLLRAFAATVRATVTAPPASL